MGLLVIVDHGSRPFRIGKGFCKQCVTFGAKVLSFLLNRWPPAIAAFRGTPDLARDTSPLHGSTQQQLGEPVDECTEDAFRRAAYME